MEQLRGQHDSSDGEFTGREEHLIAMDIYMPILCYIHTVDIIKTASVPLFLIRNDFRNKLVKKNGVHK